MITKRTNIKNSKNERLGLLLLMASLAMLVFNGSTPVIASTSDEEEEEEEEVTEEEEAPTEEEVEEEGDLGTGTSNGGGLPFIPASPAPAQTPIEQQVAPTTTPAPTVNELIQKYGANQTIPPQLMGNFTTVGDKAVILTFDDNWKSQHDYAEPILRDNGFNATFFIYCLGVEQGPGFMMSDDVRDLYAKGYDIQSHSMTHKDLEHVDASALNFEVATSKQCLQDMVPGLETTIFASPFATGEYNATVLEAIASTYDVGRVGYGASFDIKCAGYYVPENQTQGCQLYEPGTTDLKFQNRYNIPVADANGIGRVNNHDLDATQEAFVRLLNDSISYDTEGEIKSLPVLVYHNFSNRVLPPEEMGQSLLAESFAQQMQYLNANNFTVLAMSDLVYDQNNETFSIPKLEQQ